MNSELEGPTFSEGIKSTVLPRDVEWEMDWSQRNKDGQRLYPEKPEKETVFEDGPALAVLLLNEVVFLNSHHWEEGWPEDARKRTSLNVNCSDVFAWGCADAECIDYSDIKGVYQYWLKDPTQGASVWCMIRRKEMPQRPVEKAIRAAGIWDLEALKAEHALRANYYDGVSRVLSDHKYRAYTEWESSEGREPLPIGQEWWGEWKRYTDANPAWYCADWKAEDDRLLADFRLQNGFAP